MAKTKPVDIQEQSDKYEKLVVEATARNKIVYVKKKDISQPDPGKLDNILGQRQRQRKWLFRYALWFSSLTFIGLVVMLVAQGIYTMHHQQPLFGKLELGTVAVGVFVQFLGLLKIITDSLWNDKPYLDSGALSEDKK